MTWIAPQRVWAPPGRASVLPALYQVILWRTHEARNQNTYEAFDLTTVLSSQHTNKLLFDNDERNRDLRKVTIAIHFLYTCGSMHISHTTFYK